MSDAMDVFDMTAAVAAGNILTGSFIWGSWEMLRAERERRRESWWALLAISFPLFIIAATYVVAR